MNGGSPRSLRRGRFPSTGARGAAVLVALGAAAAGCGAERPVTAATAPTSAAPTTVVAPALPAARLASLTAPGQTIPDGCEFLPGAHDGTLSGHAIVRTAEGLPVLLTIARCFQADGTAQLLVTAWSDGGSRLLRLGADGRPGIFGSADTAAGAAQLLSSTPDGHAEIAYTDTRGVTATAEFAVSINGVAWAPAK